MKVLLLLFILFIHQSVYSAGGKDGGIAVTGLIGQPSVTLINPDSSEANYSGYALQGYGLLPIVGSDNFRTYLTANIRYSDLTNTASTNTETELYNALGAGVGLQISIARFMIGGDYNFMYGRHYAVGPISQQFGYNFTAINYFAQYVYPIGALQLGFRYSVNTGMIATSQAKVSRDVKYTDTTIWLIISYDSGLTLSELFGMK